MEVIIKCSDDCRGGKNIYGEPIEEIVRCKDCKWAEPNEFDDYDCRCHIPTFRVNADDFCSHGERKDDD